MAKGFLYAYCFLLSHKNNHNIQFFIKKIVQEICKNVHYKDMNASFY